MLETSQLLAADGLARAVRNLLEILTADPDATTRAQWLAALGNSQQETRVALQNYGEVRMYCKDTCPDCFCELGTNTENCARCARTAWIYVECENAPDTERSLYVAQQT